MKKYFELLKNTIKRRYYVFIVLIILLGAALRIIGANWGMPYDNMHPDEGLVFGEAYRCTLEHDTDSHTYYRPNHVSIKLNTFLYTAIQELYFAPQGMDDFAANYEANFALFTTASRVLVALFGTGCVVLAFLIALHWGRKHALYVTLFFAFLPSFIEHSHYITPDIPLLFFLLGALWTGLCYYKNPSVKWLFGMSFFTALAFCEKYPGLFGCLIIAVVVIVTRYKKPLLILRDGVLAIFFLFLGILAVSPVLIIDFRTVLEVMKGQNHESHVGADGLNFFETFVYYTQTTWIQLGLFLTLTSLYGIVAAFRKDVKKAIILMSFAVYVLPISKLSIHWERYTLPIYSAGILFGAIGFFTLMDDLKKFRENKAYITVIAYALLICLPLCSFFTGSVAQTARFLAPDTRIFLKDTFAEMGVTAENSTYDCNTPLDPGGFYGCFSNFDGPDPAFYKYGGKPTFVVTSSSQRDVFLEEDQEVYGWIADFYRKLDENYPLLYCYTGENPHAYFLEARNIYKAAKTVWHYLKGQAAGYEIRVYLYNLPPGV